MNTLVRLPPHTNDALQVLRRTTKRVAPVWPLDRFVAVNPYLGLMDHSFLDSVALLEQTGGARSTRAGGDYQALLQRKAFGVSDLEQAVRETGSSLTAERVLQMLAAGELATPPRTISTVAEVLDRWMGSQWAQFEVDHLGAWFATYFDHEAAAWQPVRGASLYATWKAEAEIDRSPEVMGARGFRQRIRALPANWEQAVSEAVERLGMRQPALELYLHRLLLRVGGWSAHAARLGWDRRLNEGAEDDTVNEVLAVLLAFEACLYADFEARGLGAAWHAAREQAAALARTSPRGGATEARVLLQLAVEKAEQRRLVARFHRTPRPSNLRPTRLGTAEARRPRVQAVFCIDVRSEVFRRHLEAADAGVETLGFAGFFGFPVELIPLGQARGFPQCPVLLAPTHRVREGVGDTRMNEAARARRTERQGVKRAWQSFKMGAISCFSFVGPVGLAYLPKLLSDAWGKTRPVPHPSSAGLTQADILGRTVLVDEASSAEPSTGISKADQVELAASALAGMSLKEGFARLVMLVGHGSSSVNNPHASALDCGACGGRTGEANARVAAALLNAPEVRDGLKAKDLHIPEDTFFLAALHDTTTDEVTVLNRTQVPSTHARELERLERSLSAAAHTSRLERGRRLEAAPASAEADWFRRSRDWAQVRPEWGLAGCSALVAAPRSRTAALDLEGRAFLHSYTWQQDAGFSVLELIMTAPMVVASWINLQYYASTVDPQLFGAGNKTLHNVVGGSLGVLEGNTGDLKVGLPWQSVHDGGRLQHEPLRLNVVIEAPIEAMNAVIEKHASVRQLLDNGWIHLFALNQHGEVHLKYEGQLSWAEVEGAPRLSASPTLPWAS